MQASITKKNRIESIDIVRGIAMVIMALDHVRDFVHIQANVDDPLNLQTTTPILFFTRWITNFCAPTFVFLSGTSIYLQSLRKTKKELSGFLIKRGLWLMFAELFIISIAWTFDPLYHIHPMQVIWAIGISMVILGLIIHLRFNFILIIGLLIFFGHNLLDIPESALGFKANFWWDLVHHGFYSVYSYAPNRFVLIVYAFLPWTGIMIMGYCAGVFFAPKYSVEKRKKVLISLGIGLLALFVLLRSVNQYGNPNHWSIQKNDFYSFLSFIDVRKYPPSLMYASCLLGIAFLLLAFLEKIENAFTKSMMVFGRTAFFYYILHLYLAHFLGAAGFFIRGGHTINDAINSMQKLPFLFIIPGEGFSLTVVYVLWIGLVVALYPLCKKYDQYKTAHKEKWWLSYL